jgi:hypothetical protein
MKNECRLNDHKFRAEMIEKRKTTVWGDKRNRKCSICKESFRGMGNNAEPINDGRCCDICNDIKVIPARLKNAGFEL